MSNQPNATPPAPHTPAIAGSSGHNLALDGVRGMAILLVMWHHMTCFKPANTAENIYFALSDLGTSGVDLFFVLSGFLITGILFDSKQALLGKAGSYFGNFYARRTLRIFPLYYAVVAFALLLLPHLADLLKHAVGPATAQTIQSKVDRFSQVQGYDHWFWLYLSNFPIAMKCNWLHGILGISWSLAIEEQFYLVWPMLVWFLSRKGAIRVCIALCVLAFICRSFLAWKMIDAGIGYGPQVPQYLPWTNPLAAYVLTFCRIDALAIGAIVALLLRGTTTISAATKAAKPLLWIGLPLFLALVATDHFMGWTNPDFGHSFGPLMQTLGYSLGGIVCAAVLVLAISARTGGLCNRFWTSALMRTFGKYAYALYLFHLPIRAVIRDVAFGPLPEAGKTPPRIVFPTIMGSQFPSQLAFYAIAITASLAAAWVSWVLFESQILKLKKFFPSGVEKRRATGSPGNP